MVIALGGVARYRMMYTFISRLMVNPRSRKMFELPFGTPLGRLHMGRTLEYFDFPRIFTCKNSTNQTYLVLSTYDGDDEYHWIYLPISYLRLEVVLSGKTPLRT